MGKIARIAIVALLLFVLLGVVMFRNAEAGPIERHLTIRLATLPAGTPPLRIVLLSDLHVGRFGDTPNRLRQTVARIDALHPDAVLLAGDYVSSGVVGFVPMRPALAPLASLKPRLGMFAVLGNNDYRIARTVARVLREIGAEVLDNSAARAGPLAIVGVSDAFSHHDRAKIALAAAEKVGGTPVLLTHSPDVIAHLPRDIELALAGHTHCGQIVLPLLGPIDTRSRYGRRYLCGVVREGPRTAVITAGLGTSRVPFRLGAPPDFWVITIESPTH